MIPSSHNAEMANIYREAQRLSIPLAQELVDWFRDQAETLSKGGDDGLTAALYEWDLDVAPGTWNRAFCSEFSRDMLKMAIYARNGIREIAEREGKVGTGDPSL